MKTTIASLFVLACASLALTGCGGHHESKKSTQVEKPAQTVAPALMPAYTQWEYKTLRLVASAIDFDKQLNDAGAQGWKLISVTPEADGYAFYTFERLRQQQQ